MLHIIIISAAAKASPLMYDTQAIQQPMLTWSLVYYIVYLRSLIFEVVPTYISMSH